MSNSKGIGAPKGGRVHWLLWELGSSFKGAYKLYFDYAWHKYVFYRTEKQTLVDVFIVMQTSRHCWRCMYSNTKTNDFDVFSCTQTRDMACICGYYGKRTKNCAKYAKNRKSLSRGTKQV